METEPELNIDFSEPQEQELLLLLEKALEYQKAGLSIIPTKKSKQPPLKHWKPYQEKPASPEQLAQWFPRYQYVAIICGKVSGNIELIDFDHDEKRPDIFHQWRKLFEDECPGLFKKLVIQTTQNNGFHVCYSCPEIEIPSNQVLARYNNGESLKTLIETRGQGGYFLADPSPGYKLRQGDFVDIPVLTPTEREILIRSAKLLNEHAMPAKKPPKSSSGGEKRDGLSPGDDFNERGDIRAFLEGKGWTYAGARGDVEHWRRPGKDRGNSASLLDGKTFYNFSSNAHPLEPNQSYDLFGLYSLYEHGGDFNAAAKALARKGYGDQPTKGQKKKRILTFDTLRNKYQEGTVRWIWRQHIPVGMPIIVNGREGIGKTTNCIQMAKEILDTYQENSVVWVASEGFIKDTINKFEHLDVDGSRLFILENEDENNFTFNFARRKDLGILDNYLKQAANEGLTTIAVFIDSIRGISPYDDNESKIKNVMMALNSIVCDQHNSALVYLDHWSKGQRDNLLDKAVGTTAKTAAVRAVYSITSESAYTRSIQCAKMNLLGQEPATLKSVESSNGIIIYEATEKTDHSLVAQAEKYLIEIFSLKPTYSAQNIYEEAEERGIGSETLKKAKKKLGIESVRGEGIGGSWEWKCTTLY